jgi:endonuclease/exonuclease/phosphatase family metal-dependent hydrolase
MHHGRLTRDQAAGLKQLKARIRKANIPSSRLDETLLIATWNIREFGRRKRLALSLHYIAEIIGQFDVVVLVEVRDNVEELATVQRYLGPYWDVLYSDYILDAGGNRERIAVVYDTRAARFTGFASHVFGPREKHESEWLPEHAWWRPPYTASFRAGNFDFVVVAAHVRWSTGERDRLREVELLAEYVERRASAKSTLDQDVIVVGDFNIPNVKGELFRALTKRGLRMPAMLAGIGGSDLLQSKRYDQILHSPAFSAAFTGEGGVLDFWCGEHAALYPGKRMDKREFTYELSDHLPVWVEINTDNDDEVLDQVVNGRR